VSLLVVTGGSGSLGRAIIRQEALLLENGVKRVRVISRDEQKQVFMTRHLKPKHIQLDCYLGDVSDKERMMFALNDADYVIHTAAQKHIEKFELDVKTGYKTNVIGTQNVADAFHSSSNAKQALFISTDKAVNPITTYGISKLAAEKLWSWYNTFQGMRPYKIARYGNIFGSRGSVIETWTRAAKEKSSMLITDKLCTRFFMMIDDAAEFVLNSLFHSKNILNIPEMKSADMFRLAEIIWQYHNPTLPMDYKLVGMRSIEKLHEVLEIDGKTSEQVERFSDEELRSMYMHWIHNEYGAHL
jgi:FlaA1/EpsC-like NDP-sugar epimerase